MVGDSATKSVREILEERPDRHEDVTAGLEALLHSNQRIPKRCIRAYRRECRKPQVLSELSSKRFQEVTGQELAAIVTT